MTSRAEVVVADAERLTRQMARHFGHKVPVEERDGATVVQITAGAFALQPDGPMLRAWARAADRPELLRVQEVCTDHLRRFARAALPVEWSDEGD